MDNSNESSLSSSSFSTSLTFSLRTIYLKGKSPWGFRIVTSKDESTSNQELIVVSKVNLALVLKQKKIRIKSNNKQIFCFRKYYVI